MKIEHVFWQNVNNGKPWDSILGELVKVYLLVFQKRVDSEMAKLAEDTKLFRIVKIMLGSEAAWWQMKFWQMKSNTWNCFTNYLLCTPLNWVMTIENMWFFSEKSPIYGHDFAPTISVPIVLCKQLIVDINTIIWMLNYLNDCTCRNGGAYQN